MELATGRADANGVTFHYLEIPGTGHFVHVERPGEVNRRIVAFLQAAGGAKGR